MEEKLCHASGNQDAHHGFAVDKSALSTKQYFRGMFPHLPGSMQQRIKTILKAEVQPRRWWQRVPNKISGDSFKLKWWRVQSINNSCINTMPSSQYAPAFLPTKTTGILDVNISLPFQSTLHNKKEALLNVYQYISWRVKESLVTINSRNENDIRKNNGQMLHMDYIWLYSPYK